ncbi:MULTISPECIES: hypothetical protein [unclassified Mesorhizobium]|uniref:hypothetical protein n=1 Tax=unclassified Mesorhizobium TaxID=325217 RepID=UPI0033355266
MTKRNFLSPIALSASIILGTPVQAAVSIDSAEAIANATETSVSPGNDGFGVVLDRSSGTEVRMAYHSSHSSHSSHGSHCSGYSYC